MDIVCSILGNVVTRLWDCTANQALYILELREKLNSLRDLKRELEAISKDVENSAVVQEQQQYSVRTNRVKDWLERVQLILKEVDDSLKKGDAEIQQKCLGSCCPRHCCASYRLGKEVDKMIGVVKELIRKGNFDVVAEKVPRPMIDEMPMETTVGMESMFDEVWRCVKDNKAGIIGLYGMGGTGKTTLLKKLNNKFLKTSHNFDVVIWVEVPKEDKLEKIQETILNKFSIPKETWIQKSVGDRAVQIWEILKNKRFVLLLDDLWEKLDVSKVGVSLSNNQEEFKIVFTTRLEEVCGQMGAKMKFKLHGLSHKAARKLFLEKVGEDVLKSHYKIPKLAEIVVEKCNGLPLALVTIGSAMASKKKPEDWMDAIEDLKSYPAQFPEMGKYVFPILKFSYDNLENKRLKACFLYCSTFSEDHNIRDDELIQLWIGEGFFDDSKNLYEAKKSGRYIIESLKRACLLEESKDEETGEQNHVKMHDVLRIMAHWLAHEQGKEILVKEHADLIESQDIATWKDAVRVSLSGDSIQFHIERPSICPHLQTVFIMGSELETLPGTLFQSMYTLQVLNLSNNEDLMELPVEIGALINLHYLNLSHTCLKKLPIEVKNLTQLRILLLDHMMFDNKRNGLVIPQGVISSLLSLEMLSSFHCCVGMDDETRLMEELECLDKITNVSLTLSSVLGVQKFMSSSKLQSCITQLSIFNCKELHSFDITSSTMGRMKHLETLHIEDCPLREVDICLENGKRMKRSESNWFRDLQNIYISNCAIVNLTWLLYTPRIRSLKVEECDSLEEIISSGEFGSSEIEEDVVDLFSNLEIVYFWRLPKLKSICRPAMPFPSLRKIEVGLCESLTKLPFNAESAKSLRRIYGEIDWWKGLEWEDEATEHAFTSKYQWSAYFTRPYYYNYNYEMRGIFSDEDPNACRIM